MEGTGQEGEHLSFVSGAEIVELIALGFENGDPLSRCALRIERFATLLDDQAGELAEAGLVAMAREKAGEMQPTISRLVRRPSDAPYHVLLTVDRPQ